MQPEGELRRAQEGKFPGDAITGRRELQFPQLRARRYANENAPHRLAAGIEFGLAEDESDFVGDHTVPDTPGSLQKAISRRDLETVPLIYRRRRRHLLKCRRFYIVQMQVDRAALPMKSPREFYPMSAVAHPVGFRRSVRRQTKSARTIQRRA